ncbi:MAG TPA: SH3 domain-containing protein, partial [Caldilineaceae bacterium]|nr:SH3 domain-containing protein [Caldilineaceae bacterium]
MLVLLLAACGPESSNESKDQLTADVEQIALEYQTSGNLEQASARLASLAVANPNQWLIFVTESSIEQNGDPNTLVALVKLTTALELQSGPITDYGVQHGLLAATKQGSDPAVVAVAAATNQPATAEAPAQPSPTETPAPSVALTPTTAVTPTTVVSPTAQAVPMAKASDLLNVRSGPGTDYAIIGGLQKDEVVQITGKSPANDWWQVKLSDGQQGWLMGELVEVLGETGAGAGAADIPAPPPTATPAQVAEA